MSVSHIFSWVARQYTKIEDVEREHIDWSKAIRNNPNHSYYIPPSQNRNQANLEDARMSHSRGSSVMAGDGESVNDVHSFAAISANSGSAR